jgi:hypothetical protein
MFTGPMKTVSVWKNRVFSDTDIVVRSSEPISVGGWARAKFGLNVHGISAQSGASIVNSACTITFQHASSPETANPEAWTTLDASTPQANVALKGLTTFDLIGFLPYIRITYIHQGFNGVIHSGILTSEISVVGHFFRE